MCLLTECVLLIIFFCDFASRFVEQQVVAVVEAEAETEAEAMVQPEMLHDG